MLRFELIQVLNEKLADIINQWLLEKTTSIQIIKNPFSDFEYDFFPMDSSFDGRTLSDSFLESPCGKQFDAEGIGVIFKRNAICIGTAHLTTGTLKVLVRKYCCYDAS